MEYTGPSSQKDGVHEGSVCAYTALTPPSGNSNADTRLKFICIQLHEKLSAIVQTGLTVRTLKSQKAPEIKIYVMDTNMTVYLGRKYHKKCLGCIRL